MSHSKKSQLTRHRTRLTRAAWAAKEAIEAAGFRDPHTNRPLKGTQSIVEFALVRFNESAAEADRYLAHNGTLIAEREEIERKFGDLKRERDEYRQTSDAFQAAIQRHVNALLPADRAPAAELDELNEVQQRVATKLSQANREAGDWERAAHELDQEKSVLQQEVAELISKRDALEEKLVSARANQQEADEQAEDLACAIAERDASRKAIAELKRRISDLTQEKQALTNERDALQQTLDSITNKEALLAVREDLACAVEQRDALQRRYDELFDQAEGLRNQVGDQKLSIDRLEKDLNISRKLCASLEQDREERDRLKRMRAELDEKNADLLAELKQVAEESVALRDQVKELRIERDEARAEAVRARELLKDRQEAWEAQASTERDLRKRNDTLRVDLEQAKQGDPRWVAAGLFGFAAGAGAMLLLGWVL